MLYLKPNKKNKRKWKKKKKEEEEIDRIRMNKMIKRLTRKEKTKKTFKNKPTGDKNIYYSNYWNVYSSKKKYERKNKVINKRQ